jgi:threonine dehydratase
MTITLETVREAAGAIVGSVVATPFLHSQTLSAVTGADVWIKYENEQFTAAFKERGALNRLLSLTREERARGVLAVSAGNHAQAVAYHAKRLGIGAVIVMPRFTPHVKVERTRAHGAEVVLAGESFDAAKVAGLALAAERGLAFVHPYDDEKVIAGQGTVALEMLTANPSIEVLVVPVGGGGLIAGMATAAKAMNPDIEVIGVETAGFPAMKCALEGTTPRFARSTIAEGIAVKEPGALTLPIVRRLVSEILLVEDGDIEQAIVMLLEIEKTLAEGAGAAGFAAMLRYPERFRDRRVGVVLCGGNIDPLVLSEIIQRGLVRSGRLVRLRVELPDLPGALADVTRCLAEANANIEEVHHQRAFTSLPVLSAEVEFVLQARGADHVAEIRASLAQAGYESELLHESERAR